MEGEGCLTVCNVPPLPRDKSFSCTTKHVNMPQLAGSILTPAKHDGDMAQEGGQAGSSQPFWRSSEGSVRVRRGVSFKMSAGLFTRVREQLACEYSHGGGMGARGPRTKSETRSTL